MGSHQIASNFLDRDRGLSNQPSFMTGRGSGLPAPQQGLACLSPWSPSPLRSVAESGELRRSEAELAQSNGGWRRGGGRRAQKNPIKGTRLINNSNNKEGLKASPQSPLPVSGEQWQESVWILIRKRHVLQPEGEPGARGLSHSLRGGRKWWVSCPWGT